ncbi:helix-turn-helix domain-containing protein [Streptomyces sp. NPDC058108]|uniref:helix-turn-helix domain-containing protein n=1 Tax=Streptomyces sp. NPDC058108 TaxID=3346344 RepID=UPI0036E246CA
MRGARERRSLPGEVAATLRAARERAGLGVREAARLMDVSHSYVIGLEGGTRCPSVTMAARIAGALGLGDEERRELLAAAVTDAGLDHPHKARRVVS